MECDNQATAPVHMLKSGETVFLYYDHLTGEQDQCLERTDPSKTSNSTEESCNSATSQDEPSHMHSIGTQTDHDVIYGSTVAMTTRNGDTKGQDTTNTQDYNSTSTETDLNAIGDRKTLETLLRWALAICTSNVDLSDQDVQELQNSNRNKSPLPSSAQVYQWGKTTSEGQQGIGLERAEFGNSTKVNNDPLINVIGETSRDNRRQDGNCLDQQHSSTLGSSDDMHAEENVVQSMEIDHHVTNELQSAAAISGNLQINLSTDKRQESGDVMAISDHLPVNLPHVDQTSVMRQESGIETVISEYCQAPLREQELGSGMVPHGDQSIGMHLDQHPPTCVFDGTDIKEEPVIQGLPSVGDNEEGNTDSNVFYPHSSTCTSSMSVAGEVNESMSQNTSNDSAAVALDHGMGRSTQIDDHPNDMERSTHAEERPYECDGCGKRFKKRSHLTVHLAVHMVEKPFGCNVCGKKFTVKWNLKTHMRLHSQEQPYACTICKKRFKQCGSLSYHMRVVHSQEKPYACTVCKRRFTSSGNLTTHMRVHTGERPYICQFCSKRFIRQHHLNRHLGVHCRETK